MRILQLGKFYPVQGGVEKVMYDITYGLSNRGIDCDMLCASADNKPRDIRLNNHASIFIVASAFKAKATMISPAMILRLRRIARNYDIIHIHHPDPMAALALRISGYTGRVILHWHSDIVKQRNLLRLYSPLQQWLIDRSDSVICTSPTYAQGSPWLNNCQDKVKIVPIGIEPLTKSSDADIQAIRHKYHNKKIILSVGRLVGYKGYEYLIEAAKDIPEDAVILISGTGPLKEELEKSICNSNLSDKVILLGRVPDDELRHLYSAAYIFCLPSTMKTEAFGIVQIEAMSLGIPVIATNISGSGTGWVNANNISGLNVSPANVPELSNTIRQLILSDSLHMRLGEGAYARFNEMFTIDKMLDNIMKVYDL